MSKRKKEELAPLQTIRTETVLSKLPIHNLAKGKKIDIQILKKNEEGQIELYWKISPNSEYGHPGELAYKIDTLIINRKIEEAGRPVPESLRLGSQNEVCIELDLQPTSKNRTNVKKAFRQGAFVGISSKLDYKGRDGTERHLEADFTRYSVIFTGERLPDGKKADAIYVFPNTIYREVLNNAPVRPLDYNYLKELTPSAQRFYEILSFKIFPAIRYNLSHAKLLYSEYCAFSAQQRYYDYDHFKKQMYKIHKPHLTSGYIEKIEYQETTDDEGKIDWLMCYTPGHKAKAEYDRFNGKQLVDDQIIEINVESRKPKKSPAKKVSDPVRDSLKPSPKEKERIVAKAADPEKSVLELIQYFHKLARNRDNYRPHPGSKELSQAEAVLKTCGIEKARYIVEFAVEEAKKTNFSMRNFGAVLQYVSEAVSKYEHWEAERARTKQEEAAARQQEEQYINSHLQRLTNEQYTKLYEDAKKQSLKDFPQLAVHQNADFFQTLIKREMVRMLTSKDGTRK
jgi:hypothetical protein